MNDKNEAIAWLANIKEKYIHGGDEEFDECRRESIDMAIKVLRQPQIVRCKDCKNMKVMPCDIHGHIPIYCTNLGIYSEGLTWFCADGERRTDDA